VRIAIVCDNYSPHLTTKRCRRVADWAEANNAEIAYTPTNSSWLNRIEAQFTALRYFALDGTDHRSHKEQGSMIRRYIIWRNRHADDTRLRQIIAETLAAYGHLVMTEFALAWSRIRAILPESSRAYIEMSMEQTRPVDLAEYLRLTGIRLGLQRDWAYLFQRYHLVLGPVFTEPPVEPNLESSSMDGHKRVTRAMRLCTATSFVGLPAVAVSGGVFNGLPQGVQLIGPMYREDLCLAGAEAIERRIGVLTPVSPFQAARDPHGPQASSTPPGGASAGGSPPGNGCTAGARDAASAAVPELATSPRTTMTSP
jgi:Asp-tRNA(Asn)/Glu-tRNA(Gln) amidotransferase A subunit family amidase